MHRSFYPISFEANIFNRTIARLLKKGKVRGIAGDCPGCCGRAAYEFYEIWFLLSPSAARSAVVTSMSGWLTRDPTMRPSSPEPQPFSLDFSTPLGYSIL